MTLSRTKRTSVLSLSVLLLGLLVFGTAPANGQGVDIRPGIRAGVDFMTQGGDVGDEIGRRTGFLFGTYATFDFAGPFAIQPELSYVQKGAQTDQSFSLGGGIGGGGGDVTVTSTRKLGYIEAPILAKLQIPIGGVVSPSIFAGPSVGVNVGATRNVEVEGVPNLFQGVIGDFVENQTGFRPGENDIENVSTFEFGLTFGAGADFGLGVGSASLDFRYGLGLTSIASEGDDTVRNQGFMITAGYAF